MRCPKCGYISFDHLEKCRKCKKNIMDTAMEINGTIYDITSPSFLQLVIEDTADEEGSWVEGAEQESVEDLDRETALFTEDAFAYSDEQSNTIPTDDLADVDLKEGLDEGAATEQFTLPSLNFGDLDITDLAPPERKGFPLEKEPALAAAGKVTAGKAPKQAEVGQGQKPRKKSKAFALADLQLEGLDLESSPRLVFDAATKRNLPDVKTGTALDSFDIDLGNLFDESKDTPKK